MPYKISGTLSDAARIVVIKESDWSIESNTEESVGAYEIDSLETGAKLVLSRKSDGESMGYGAVASEYYAPPFPPGGDRGVWGGGIVSGGSAQGTIDYITISSTGNATYFGELTVARDDTAACSNGGYGRGIFGGGWLYGGPKSNVIDYITITSTGAATDFGDLIGATKDFGGISNGTNNRGVFGGEEGIEYITISSIGNATSFGNLTSNRDYIEACSNGRNDRGIFSCSGTNVIEYITISSTGDATDFGDLTVARRSAPGLSNGTNNRGCFAGGFAMYFNIIDYITITSLGNATDFGDLTVARLEFGGTSNGTNDRGVWGGGASGVYEKTIDYITISTPANATDFGDLAQARQGVKSTSNG